MKPFLLGFMLWLVYALAHFPAYGQGLVLPCYVVGPNNCQSISLANPLPTTGGISGTVVVNSVASSAPRTARGTTITAGGTSQTLMAANSSRKGFTIQNPCSLTTEGITAAESLFINFTSAASVSSSANAIEIAPCSSYSEGLNGGAVSQEAVNIIGATTGHIIYAKEF